MYVDLTNPNAEANKTIYFGSENPGTELGNSPFVGRTAFYGYREVRWNGNPGNQTHLITVELHEQYPVAGRIWANTYNKDMQNWMGWKCFEPRSIITKEHKITLNKVTSPTANNYTIDVSLPGYIPIIATGDDSGNMDNNIFYCKVSGNNVNLGIKQGYTGDRAIQASITVMYLHS